MFWRILSIFRRSTATTLLTTCCRSRSRQRAASRRACRAALTPVWAAPQWCSLLDLPTASVSTSAARRRICPGRTEAGCGPLCWTPGEVGEVFIFSQRVKAGSGMKRGPSSFVLPVSAQRADPSESRELQMDEAATTWLSSARSGWRSPSLPRPPHFPVVLHLLRPLHHLHQQSSSCWSSAGPLFHLVRDKRPFFKPHCE